MKIADIITKPKAFEKVESKKLRKDKK